jgi:hypothetical protein
VDSIKRQLAELLSQVPPVLTLVEAGVDAACGDASTQWIQAKGLMEVLAPGLREPVSRLEADLSALQADVSTPERADGASLTRADASFAHLLAQAKAIVDHLNGEDVAP